MAVTIHNTPQLFTPSDNPVNWTFSSDMTGEDNFVFIIEVFVNGTLVANELVSPDNGIYARFNAQSFASNASNSPVIGYGTSYDSNNYSSIRIRIVERYGVIPIDQATATTTDVIVFKARLEDELFIAWDHTEYLGSTATRWLSNFPDNEIRNVKDFGEQQRLMAITNNDSSLTMSIELFNSFGTSIVSETGISTITSTITGFNVSPEQIVASTPITLSQFQNASYYVISMSSDLPDIRINIDRGIVYDNFRRIHFLSEIGSIESFTFALISREGGNIKSFGYRKQFGEWSGSDFIYSNEQGRDIDYAKVSMREIVIESDWINQNIQHWIFRNMYESPLVLEEKPLASSPLSTGLFRRSIKNTSWADKYDKNDMLFKEKITLGLPHKTSMIL